MTGTALRGTRGVIPYLRATQIRNYSWIHRFSSEISREYFSVIGDNSRNLRKHLFSELFTEKYVGFDGRPPEENLPCTPSEWW
jgi:hypothetical protein